MTAFSGFVSRRTGRVPSEPVCAGVWHQLAGRFRDDDARDSALQAVAASEPHYHAGEAESQGGLGFTPGCG